MLIEKYEVELSEPACGAGMGKHGVLVKLPADISGVFPYLNALAKSARYNRASEVLLLDEPQQRYALRPREIRIAGASDLPDAQEKAREIVGRLNEVWQNKDGVTPDYTERENPPVMEIFKLLPGTNCRDCGYATCMAFAAALSRAEERPEGCTPLSPENMAQLKKVCYGAEDPSK